MMTVGIELTASCSVSTGPCHLTWKNLHYLSAEWILSQRAEQFCFHPVEEGTTTPALHPFPSLSPQYAAMYIFILHKGMPVKLSLKHLEREEAQESVFPSWSWGFRSPGGEGNGLWWKVNYPIGWRLLVEFLKETNLETNLLLMTLAQKVGVC